MRRSRPLKCRRCCPCRRYRRQCRRWCSVSALITVWQSSAICALWRRAHRRPVRQVRFSFRTRRVTVVRPCTSADGSGGFQSRRRPASPRAVYFFLSLDHATSFVCAEAQRPDARTGGAGLLVKKWGPTRNDMRVMRVRIGRRLFLSAGAGRIVAEHRRNRDRTPAENVTFIGLARTRRRQKRGRSAAETRQKSGRNAGEPRQTERLTER